MIYRILFVALMSVSISSSASESDLINEFAKSIEVSLATGSLADVEEISVYRLETGYLRVEAPREKGKPSLKIKAKEIVEIGQFGEIKITADSRKYRVLIEDSSEIPLGVTSPHLDIDGFVDPPTQWQITIVEKGTDSDGKAMSVGRVEASADPEVVYRTQPAE